MNQATGDLYREQILEWANSAKQMVMIKSPTAEATKYNMACGDTVRVLIKTSADKISDVSVATSGCVICSASAGIMCHALKGASKKQAQNLIKQATDVITLGKNHADDEMDLLSTVSQFPNRVRCAILAWEAIDDVLRQDQ